MEITLVLVSAEDRFRLWYKEPLEALEKMEWGQAAIAALMVVLPLYERCFRFAKVKGETDNRAQWVKDDLKLATNDEAELFLNVFRDGLCHTGSFFNSSRKGSLPKVGLDAKYPVLPQFVKNQDGEDVIIVNPWGLISHVLQKFEGNVELLEFEQAPLLPLHYVVSKRGEVHEE